jgi:hypothetical protein
MYGYRFISPCFFPTFFLTSHASSSCLFIICLSAPCLHPFSVHSHVFVKVP